MTAYTDRWPTHRKKKEAEAACERTKMLGLTDKDIKATIIDIFKDSQAMLQKLRKVLVILSYQKLRMDLRRSSSVCY